MLPQLQNIVFSAGSLVDANVTRCFSVETRRDSSVEGDEVFGVSVTDVNGNPADTVVVTAPSIISVLIQDNTGKFKLQNFSLFLHNPLFFSELIADFETEMSVSESEEQVEICVSFSVTSFESTIVLLATSEPGTAASKIQTFRIYFAADSYCDSCCR